LVRKASRLAVSSESCERDAATPRHPLGRSSDSAIFGALDARKPLASKLNVLGFHVDTDVPPS
jgi:hypothetical protein